MSDEKLRLSKLMAQKGICSRREADEYISKGWVSVDGVVIDQLGTQVSPHARVTLSAQALKQQKNLVTIILNKPVGYVSSQPEDNYKPAIQLITLENQDPQFIKNRKLKMGDLAGIATAGRLDIDSQGLLVFTQDGRIARELIQKETDIEKEYLVRVEGTLPKDKLKLLNHGLELDGQKLKPAQVEWLNEDQLKFILKEGKKRQVRRMCEMVGLRVTGLKRVRVGQVKLGKLKEGMWRFLEPDEEF